MRVLIAFLNVLIVVGYVLLFNYLSLVNKTAYNLSCVILNFIIIQLIKYARHVLRGAIIVLEQENMNVLFIKKKKNM